MRQELDDLTPEQHAAVTHAGGPLLVLAGAGAGKTRVLCRRLAWLVEQGARPDEILALTFSRKAAEELRTRAEAAIHIPHETLGVRTFHAYAIELLRVHGVEQGLLEPRELIGEEERRLMLIGRLDEFDLRVHDLRGDRVRLVDDLVRRMDRCRDELVAPKDFRRWAEEALAAAPSPAVERQRALDLEFGRAFEAHDRWLDEEGLEDFGLAISRALSLLRAHPDRLTAAAAGARHVLIDEFQDTNHAQAELLYLVAGGADSLVVVGDDDQGIYRFRGASTKNVTDFRERFAAAGEVRLERNYRSSQPILAAATAVVEPIEGRATKRLVAAHPDGPPPEFWRAQDQEGQAGAVVERILTLAEEGVPLREQAVLMRAVRLEARPVIAALERAGVPHQVRGGVGLFERREVRAAVAWLRAAVAPDDVQAHLRIVAGVDGIPWSSAAEAVVEHAAAGRSATAALTEVARLADRPSVATTLEDLAREAVAGDPRDLTRAVIDRSGLRAQALAAGGAEGAARLAGLAALERLSGDILRRHVGLDARGLSDLIGGLADVGYHGDAGAPGEADGVQVMTVHQAKGLEFDAVHIIGMTEAAWPGRERKGADIPDQLLPEALPRGAAVHMAEARRLAYVALTRARRHLVVCAPATSAGGAAQRPSRFFEEAREAAGGRSVQEVGGGAERAVLHAVAGAREAFELASSRAAEARAAGRADADALLSSAEAAAAALVAARADALAPAPAPAPAPRPAPAQPAAPAPSVVLSASDVEAYRRCPLAYRYARVDRIPPVRSVQRAIGVAAHEALEAHYRPEGPGGDGPALVRRFATRLRAAGEADSAEGRQALSRAGEWFPRYHEIFVKSRVRPVAVERPFTLPLGPHRLRGRIDRVDAHPAGGFQLVDYKTGSPPGQGTRADADLVLRIYLEGARAAWGVEARGARLDYVLDGDRRPVNPETNELAEALEVARRTADDIARRRFAPTPSWACRTCDFARICPAQDR